MAYVGTRRYPDNASRQRAYRQRHAKEVADLRQKAELKAYLKSTKDDWSTPPDIFAEYDAEFHFTVDVCATADNYKCVPYWTAADNALVQDWGRHVCWMNPPYSAVQLWLRKAYYSSCLGATVLCLIPTRLGTQWWRRWVEETQAEIRQRYTRITFLGARDPAPFYSTAVIYRPPPRLTP